MWSWEISTASTAYIPAMYGQPLLDEVASDSGVEQEFDAIGLDVDAVAVAAGLEGDDFHGTIVPETGWTMALIRLQETTNPADECGVS